MTSAEPPHPRQRVGTLPVAGALIGVLCITVFFLVSSQRDLRGRLDTVDLRQLQLETFALWEAEANGSVPPARWPPTLHALEAESVRVTAEGVYIRTSSDFATESGLFVPAPGSTFEPEPGGDPSYAPLSGGMYSYHIAG